MICVLHFREASNTQELLRVKCKEMLSQNFSKRYEGIIDDADMNLWPAPLKIAEQTINSMQEFRVRIQCVIIKCRILWCRAVARNLGV